MHEITTAVDIQAPAAKVWDELLDFAAHPHWNPFLRAISGEPRVGGRLEVRLQPVGGRAMTVRPTVLVADAGQELRWRGEILMRALFEGEHYFRIRPTGPASCTLEHGEKFSGLLVPLARNTLEQGTRAGFEAMNLALKTRAEAVHAV
jgi:hypothetical protein